MLEKLKKDLLLSVEKYIESDEELRLINKALKFAEEKYENVLDFNGNNYIFHTVRTAIILTELHSDYVTIIAGLVHWTVILSKDVSIDTIKEEFGPEVANIVESISKINKLKLKEYTNKSANYLRKILVGLSTDVRVIIIKLCGRLDNLRNVYTTSSEEQKQKCIETKEVLIPIAHRLGINYVKSELEDLCLRYTKPDAYNEVVDLLNGSKEELNKCIDEMKNTLSEIMLEHGIKYRIKGRVKSIHSLYEKLSKGKRWNQIYDVLALRIITEKESDCYLAIGLIHAKYRPIPNRFKDYIAQPKENMYQSLHTGIIGPNGRIYEIQIRTEEMDEIAECGIASHWSYKEHGSKNIQSLMEQKLELFRDSLDITDENSDAELEEEFKATFIEKMIYVFTPKGDVIELPEKSTPVDYAYRVHSHVGDTMVAAIVNGQIVPIDYELQNDDIVQIKTNESSSPKKEWLSFVKTRQAKNKIKAFFSKQDREVYITRGEELINKEIRRRKWSINETLSEENINKLTKLLKLKDFEELKLSVGSLRYTANYVLSLLNEDKQDVRDLMVEKITSGRSEKGKYKNYKNSITVAGKDDILINIANCCKPVYGDKIIGYITRGNGVTVHREDCPNIDSFNPRSINVEWSEISTETFLTGIVVKTNNINNNLLDIVTKASLRNVSIDSINTIKYKNLVNYELLVKVPNIEVLNLFMIDLETLNFVVSVERNQK